MRGALDDALGPLIPLDVQAHACTGGATVLLLLCQLPLLSSAWSLLCGYRVNRRTFKHLLDGWGGAQATAALEQLPQSVGTQYADAACSRCWVVTGSAVMYNQILRG